MAKTIKRFFPALFFIFLLLILLLAPMKDKAEASGEILISITEDFDGIVYVCDEYGTEQTLAPGVHLFYYVFDYFIIYPVSVGEVKIGEDSNFVSVITSTTFFYGNRDYGFPDQIYIRKKPQPPLIQKHNVNFVINDTLTYSYEIEHNQTINLACYDWYSQLHIDLYEHYFHLENDQNKTPVIFEECPITNDINFYLEYTKVQCKIIYNNNGEKFERIIDMGACAPNIPIPDDENSYFLGWQKSGQVEYFDFSQQIFEDIVLEAHIVEDICFITYFIETEIRNQYNEYTKIKIQKGSLATEILPPTNDSDTFIGWQELDANNINYDFMTPIYENINLYAIYQSDLITVTINLDGGHAQNFIQTQTIRDGQNFQPILPDSPIKTGYTFIEWDIDKTNNNVNYKALYEPLSLRINYYLQYPNEERELVYEFTAYYNQILENFYSVNDQLKEGWEFMYWYKENQNEEYTNKLITENLDLTAKIKIKTFTVHIIYDNNQLALCKEYGESIVSSEMPVCEQGSFYEWRVGGMEGELFVFGILVREDLTIYGTKKIREFNVLFELIIDDEDFSFNETIEYNNCINCPQIEILGYEILWYADNEYENLYDFSKTINEDIYIYGLVTPNEYTITINLSMYEMQNHTYSYKYKDTINLDSLKISGYSHDGAFYLDNELFVNETMPCEDLELSVILKVSLTLIYGEKSIEHYVDYGKSFELPWLGNTEMNKFVNWKDQNGFCYNQNIEVRIPTVLKAIFTEKDTYTVTFIKENEQIQITVIEGEKVSRLNQTQQEIYGYTFENWYSDIEKTQLFDFESTIINQDTIIYGKYNRILCTVVFIGKDNEELETITVYFGEKINNLEYVNREVEGWEFMGWYLDEQREQEVDFENTLIENGFIIYGKYKKISITLQIINLLTNTIETKTFDYGEKLKQTDVFSQEIQGYTFDNWYADEDCHLLIDFDNFFVTKPCSLFAKYIIKTYTINVYGLDNVLIDTLLFEHNDLLDLSEIKTNTTTHNFLGWYLDKNYNTLLENGYKVIKEQNIFAKYQHKTFTVNFIGLNNESLLTQDVLYGQAATAPTPECCEIEGYFFNGFDKGFEKITNNLIVKALYLPIVYKDEFGNPLNTSSPPEKDGYEFVEWKKQQEEGYISYTPVYQKTSGERQASRLDFFNSAFLEIFIRIALIIILAVIIAIVKSKSARTSPK